MVQPTNGRVKFTQEQRAMCQNEEIYYKGWKLEYFIDMKLKHEAESRLNIAMIHITQQYLEANPRATEIRQTEFGISHLLWFSTLPCNSWKCLFDHPCWCNRCSPKLKAWFEALAAFQKRWECIFSTEFQAAWLAITTMKEQRFYNAACFKRLYEKHALLRVDLMSGER